MDWKIPLFKIHSNEEDVNAVTSVLRKGMFWKDGPEIKQFEDRIKDYIGTKYSLVFNSGTSALHTLLIAYGVEGEEVIVPSFTFISTVNSVELAGAKPIFSEVEKESFGLDASDVEKKITEKTKAIIVVHYAGFPARDTKKLRELADKHDLILIEDVAESMGASIDGKKLGAFGHAAMLSFCENKIITTGEGGAILTDSQEIYERCKFIRSHGRFELSDDYFSLSKDTDFVVVGYNYRMPTKNAALGISQLNRIDELIMMRREKRDLYHLGLSHIKEISFIKEQEGSHSVCQLFTIFLNNQETRDRLMDHLTSKGIMSKVYFPPAHLKTIYKEKYGFGEGFLPNTEKLSNQVLSLPFYPHMPEEDIATVCTNIEDFFKSRN